MKTFTCFLLGLCLSASLFAQPESAGPNFPPEELDKLVAPIALYPDSLIALILPASTTSSDVVLAARYLAANGDPSAIDYQPWSDSVKSLAHYPVVVKWMDDNFVWTQQLGEVFEAQPADVMNAIQRLRAQARQDGLLADTAQQRIVMQDDQICIVPAQPDVIYVPRYDPDVLWMRRRYSGTYITFGVGFGVGNWLYFDCDWRGREVWVQHRQPGWVYHPGWRRPEHETHAVVGAPWHPDARRVSPARLRPGQVPVAVRARGMADPQRDPHGRAAQPPVQTRGTPMRSTVTVPAANRPMSPKHAVVPPPPGPERRQPTAVQQPPRDRQREYRDGGYRPSPQVPHPPSHTPVMHRAPQVPAVAPAVRSGGAGGRPGSVSPAASPARQSSPAAKSSGQDRDDSQRGRPDR